MAEKRDLSGRVWLVDELRGAFILLRVVYHTFYDLVYIFDVNIPAFRWTFTTWIQLLIAGLFVFLSGVASRFSRIRRSAFSIRLMVRNVENLYPVSFKNSLER